MWPPTSTNIFHLWIYCATGFVTVILLMIMICFFAFRQECSEMKARKRAKTLHYARLQEWRQQMNSFPDLTHRPASDILIELGIGQHQPKTESQPI